MHPAERDCQMREKRPLKRECTEIKPASSMPSIPPAAIQPPSGLFQPQISSTLPSFGSPSHSMLSYSAKSVQTFEEPKRNAKYIRFYSLPLDELIDTLCRRGRSPVGQNDEAETVKRQRMGSPKPNPARYIRVRFFKDSHDWHHFLDGRVPRESDRSIDLSKLAAGLRLPEGCSVRVRAFC